MLIKTVIGSDEYKFKEVTAYTLLSSREWIIRHLAHSSSGFNLMLNVLHLPEIGTLILLCCVTLVPDGSVHSHVDKGMYHGIVQNCGVIRSKKVWRRLLLHFPDISKPIKANFNYLIVALIIIGNNEILDTGCYSPTFDSSQTFAHRQY